MQDIRAGRRVRVTADGSGVVGHAGALLLANLADSLGLTGGFCRRERPHPGAQQSLFDREWGLRHQVFVTNSRGDIELRHRAHAHVEVHIRELKATGGENLPFADVVSNQAWLMLVLVETP
jgi:hypothetical protein